MRLRRFRPTFDRLDLRIAPSDTAPGVTTSLTDNQTYDSGSSTMNSNDPGLDVDLSGTMTYCTGNGSDSNPFEPEF